MKYILRVHHFVKYTPEESFNTFGYERKDDLGGCWCWFPIVIIDDKKKAETVQKKLNAEIQEADDFDTVDEVDIKPLDFWTTDELIDIYLQIDNVRSYFLSDDSLHRNLFGYLKRSDEIQNAIWAVSKDMDKLSESENLAVNQQSTSEDSSQIADKEKAQAIIRVIENFLSSFEKIDEYIYGNLDDFMLNGQIREIKVFIDKTGIWEQLLEIEPILTGSRLFIYRNQSRPTNIISEIIDIIQYSAIGLWNDLHDIMSSINKLTTGKTNEQVADIIEEYDLSSAKGNFVEPYSELAESLPVIELLFRSLFHYKRREFRLNKVLLMYKSIDDLGLRKLAGMEPQGAKAELTTNPQANTGEEKPIDLDEIDHKLIEIYQKAAQKNIKPPSQTTIAKTLYKAGLTPTELKKASISKRVIKLRKAELIDEPKSKETTLSSEHICDKADTHKMKF